MYIYIHTHGYNTVLWLVPVVVDVQIVCILTTLWDILKMRVKYTLSLPPSLSLSDRRHTHTHATLTQYVKVVFMLQTARHVAHAQLGRRACLRLGFKDFTNQAIAPELHSLHSRLSFFPLSLRSPHTTSCITFFPAHAKTAFARAFLLKRVCSWVLFKNCNGIIMAASDHQETILLQLGRGGCVCWGGGGGGEGVRWGECNSRKLSQLTKTQHLHKLK